MTITLSGSMKFFDQMQAIATQLQHRGDKVFLPVPSVADGNGQMTLVQKSHHMREHVGFIKQSDALLVANYDKNNVAHYIGGNTFLEMGVAFALDKLIYLLHPIPQVSFSEEIEGLEPIILHGNLDGIRRT